MKKFLLTIIAALAASTALAGPQAETTMEIQEVPQDPWLQLSVFGAYEHSIDQVGPAGSYGWGAGASLSYELSAGLWLEGGYIGAADSDWQWSNHKGFLGVRMEPVSIQMPVLDAPLRPYVGLYGARSWHGGDEASWGVDAEAGVLFDLTRSLSLRAGYRLGYNFDSRRSATGTAVAGFSWRF